MTPTPKGAHAEIMLAMVEDRQLTHGRLLLGLAAVQLHAAYGVVRWKDAARCAVGNDPRFLECTVIMGGERTLMGYGGSLGWLHKMIKLDVPRYEPLMPRMHEAVCMVPTPRKEHCGKEQGWGTAFYEPDPQTGEKHLRVFCYKHRDIGRALHREIQSRPPAPTPAANRGGLLARYIDTDWERLYRWVDPEWTMPPTGPPSPLPRLAVMVTDEDEYTPVEAPRPALQSVPAPGEGG